MVGYCYYLSVEKSITESRHVSGAGDPRPDAWAGRGESSSDEGILFRS